MTAPRQLHRHRYEDYLDVEMYSNEKHEFLDGEIYVMAGGTEDHSAIAAAMVYTLFGGVRGPCKAHSSDLRIYVESVGLATFPDATVICGPLQQHTASPKATALNPTVLVEVTSDSSEEYDTVTKFEFYRTIPSLRDYIIVSHRERRITLHSRGADGEWHARTAGGGERITIPSIDTQLIVDEIYSTSSIT